MDTDTLSQVTQLGFLGVSLYEDAGSEVYFDAELPSGEKVEVRIAGSKIHYRFLGTGDPVHPDWIQVADVRRHKKEALPVENIVERSGGADSPVLGCTKQPISNSTQLSIFDEFIS